MPVVAYLTNQFPSPSESYVVEEIQELRKRAVVVVPCSARRIEADVRDSELRAFVAETLYLQPIQIRLAVRASWLCLCRFTLIADLLKLVVQPSESRGRRMRALAHTWLGAYYAARLEGRVVQHIHVHHGYFASWVAMVAARLLGISFSMTLHGSDLLLHHAYLNAKLQNCNFCVTISEFNRQHILKHHPGIDIEKITVQHIGVDPVGGPIRRGPLAPIPLALADSTSDCIILLTAGRLHPVKDHAFLVRACRLLKARGVRYICLIAGDGPERPALERLIRDSDLPERVKLLGHLSREQLDAYYAGCDLFVLTSRSEGIPLVLMEAMIRGKIVLAPAITGIPELVRNGETGFLYRAGSLEDFLSQIEMIRSSQSALEPVRCAARQHVLEHFNRNKNLESFGHFFLSQINATTVEHSHEDSLLQQI
jgi:glycosyltransferase involved in cell wall biosynthesis